jgi:hypothetical protein
VSLGKNRSIGVILLLLAQAGIALSVAGEDPRGDKRKIYYFWTEQQLDRCGAFNQSGVFLKDAPKEKCTQNIICNPESGILSSFTKDLANHITLKVLKNFSEAEDPNSSLTRPSSFASMLLNPVKSRYLEKALGSGCADFLKKIYKSGRTLSSPILIQASHTLSKEQFYSGKAHTNFYHHTVSPAFGSELHPEIADRKKANELSKRDGSYDNTFFFLRSRSTGPQNDGLWFGAIYMAEDPVSSSNYGPLTVEINFDPEKTKIIDETSPSWDPALDDLEKTYPGLESACTSALTTQSNRGFRFILADDSGIDMIDYVTYTIGSPGPHSWFQVLSLKNATSSKSY